MKTLKEYFKKRNLTRKKYSYFKENLIKYLTPEELQSLPFKNNIQKYKKKQKKIKIKKKQKVLAILISFRKSCHR